MVAREVPPLDGPDFPALPAAGEHVGARQQDREGEDMDRSKQASQPAQASGRGHQGRQTVLWGGSRREL
eukprot:2252367-Heterocapsa_arctica.AAC.1